MHSIYVSNIYILHYANIYICIIYHNYSFQVSPKKTQKDPKQMFCSLEIYSKICPVPWMDSLDFSLVGRTLMCGLTKSIFCSLNTGLC